MVRADSRSVLSPREWRQYQHRFAADTTRCAGKVVFATEEAAEAVRQSIERKSRGLRHLETYRCPVCTDYHHRSC